LWSRESPRRTRDCLKADKGEVEEQQTLDATHATILDKHDDDERVAGEREQEDGND